MTPNSNVMTKTRESSNTLKGKATGMVSGASRITSATTFSTRTRKSGVGRTVTYNMNLRMMSDTKEIAGTTSVTTTTIPTGVTRAIQLCDGNLKIIGKTRECRPKSSQQTPSEKKTQRNIIVDFVFQRE